MRQRIPAATAFMAALTLATGVFGCSSAPEPASPAKAAQKRTSGPEELFRSGQSAATRGDAVRAEQYLALALERGYDRGKVVRALVEVCVKSSRLRAALLHAEPFLRDHPDDYELRYLVATIHFALGESAQARRQLALLVHMSPKTGAAHYMLGILDGDADPDRAMRHFERYLEIEPRGSRAPEVRGRLAELRLDLESPERAEGGTP